MTTKRNGGPLTFAQVICSERKCMELSQKAFAKKLGISVSHLCDIEKGRKLVSPERACLFAKKLQYPAIGFIQYALQDQLSHNGLKKYRVEVKAA